MFLVCYLTWGSVDSQCHADILKGTEENVNNQSPTAFSKYYVHISFYRIRMGLNLFPGGHYRVIEAV